MLAIHDNLLVRHRQRYSRSVEIAYVVPPLGPFYHDATIDYLGKVLVQFDGVLPDYRIKGLFMRRQDIAVYYFERFFHKDIRSMHSAQTLYNKLYIAKKDVNNRLPVRAPPFLKGDAGGF
jgi:hypothetical protein